MSADGTDSTVPDAADAPDAEDAPGAESTAASGDRRVSVELGATAAIAVLFLILRLLAVARWDWHTVAAIADTFDFADAFPIAFGTVVAHPVVTSVFVAVMLPLFVMRLLWPSDRHRGQISVSTVLATVVLATIAVSTTVSFGHWWTVIGAAVIGAVLIATRLVWRHGLIHDVIARATRRAWLIAAVAILGITAVNDVPWVGLEHIETRTGTLDGYVLEAEPGFLHVLTEEHHRVVIIPSSDVLGRELAD